MNIPRLRFHSTANLRDYMIIIAGMAVYAIGFTAFILPHEVVVGGMTGLGTLVFFATDGFIPVAVTMYGANLLMLACWFKILGNQFVLRTIFGATTLSLFIGAIESYFTSRPPLVTDQTMSIVLGAALMGLGIGMYYSHKGSSGGTDIIAAVCEKKWNIDMGRTMMVFDVSIVACSFFLPFAGDLDARIQSRVGTIIYGWMSIVVYSTVANYIVNANKQTIQFLILSDKWKEITDHIMHETGRGVTSFECIGEWTGDNRRMLIVWCRQYNVEHIYDIIRQIDPGAYIILSEARSVYGNGFDMLRLKKKRKNPDSI